MARRGQSPRRSRPAPKRHYPRTARVNTLLQEIVADYFERIDDDDIDLLTVTGVSVDADLGKAKVFVTTLADVEADEAVLEALEQHRKGVQRAIGAETRLRRTPEVVFAFDSGIRAGARVEEILDQLDTSTDVVSADESKADESKADETNTDDGLTGEI